MRSMIAARLLALFWVLLLLSFAGFAFADSRVDFLAARLQYPPPAGQTDDFRVRTNAALALGATNDDAAVSPLCGGLSDPSEAVRTAAAVGLRRLARSSATDCLKKRLAVESSDAVKTEIQRTLDSFASTPLVANAKYYVAIAGVTNNTSRPTPEIDALIHAAVAAKLGDLGTYQVAPTGESVTQARAVMTKRNLKGFFLSVSVDPFDYSGGNLRVKVKIAVFSYPEKDLRGDVPASAAMPGASSGDKGSEDTLMKAVAGRATELFAQNFQ
jgi:hypothetical protein